MTKPIVSRREALRELAIAGLFLGSRYAIGQSQEVSANRRGRLTSRPRGDQGAAGAGTTALQLASGRDGFLHVPRGLAEGTPVPLVVLFHGAGGAAGTILSRFSAVAEATGCVLLVPDSRGPTWDAIRGDYGPDVVFLDSALSLVFSRLAVDPARVIASGFSDGASYALALGLINGDLFSRVVAFSPGFVPPGARTGKPGIFITHGDDDPILPYEATSRRIVADLKRSGDDVTFRQFAGGHTVPSELAREAFQWAVGPVRGTGNG